MVLAAEKPVVADEDFHCSPVAGDDPRVLDLLGRFLRKHGLPAETRPAAINWFALHRNGQVAVVFGLGAHGDGGIEGTDFYASPTRDGVRAVYEVLGFFKTLLDSGAIPYAVASTFTKNTVMRKRFERVFGMDGPSSVVYYYKGAANGRK